MTLLTRQNLILIHFPDHISNLASRNAPICDLSELSILLIPGVIGFYKGGIELGVRPYPLELLMLECMQRRLYPGHRELERIGDQIRRLEAGFSGEQKVDQYLEGLRLPREWWVLRDIRLRMNKSHVAQFDTLMVTDRGIGIIESKLFKGTLRYQENPRRLERIEEDGSILTFDCPIIQLENQKEALIEWLRQRELRTSVKGVVAFASRNTWLGLPEHAPFVSVKELPYIMRRDFGTTAATGGTPAHMIVNRILAEQLGPEWVRADRRYDIHPDDYNRGLLCETCHNILGWKTRRTLDCPQCGQPTGKPYRDALLDCFLLINPVITTRDYCNFTGIPSVSTGHRHLSSFELDVLGSTCKQAFRFDPKRHLAGKSLIQKRSR